MAGSLVGCGGFKRIGYRKRMDDVFEVDDVTRTAMEGGHVGSVALGRVDLGGTWLCFLRCGVCFNSNPYQDTTTTWKLLETR